MSMALTFLVPFPRVRNRAGKCTKGKCTITEAVHGYQNIDNINQLMNKLCTGIRLWPIHRDWFGHPGCMAARV